MTLLVRDEADVIETMLDCHFALGVDFVVATDNRSTDGTTEILERYQAAGRLHLIHEPDDDFQQSRWVTRMARLASTDHGADWVINADADEFWWPASGDLRSGLMSMPSHVACVTAPRFNFVVRPDGSGPFHERMRWRRTDSLTHDGARMGVKICHRASPDVVVAVGNHAVDGLGGKTLDDGSIQVLHFPLRSYDQYAGKIEQGTAALERNASYGPDVGYHWRSDADLQRRGVLKETWAGWTFDDERLAAALGTGEVVEDLRVTDLASGIALGSHAAGAGSPPVKAPVGSFAATLQVRRIGDGVTYADGAEDDVLAVLRRAHDRSSGSAELGRHIVDWPTRYHFAYQRSHLLRPLQIGPGQRVLDVGAGTGALTRYIAEQGAEVVALEGNPARAEAAAARCRGLEGVEVVCGALEDLDPAERFDVVLLCGVLEYAGAEIGGAGGAPAMAARARSHLREGGAVVIAIENQLGLKYLLGASEDHLGRPWVGIEGYSGPAGVRTWSRRQLGAVLAGAGLSAQHWFAPFPDYKLPSVVLSQRLYEQPDAAELIDRLVPQPVVCFDRPPVRVADSGGAHRVWAEAGMGLDVANSFLVVAGPTDDAVAALVPGDVLAWIFDDDRIPMWRRHRTLTEDRQLVSIGDTVPRRSGWLAQNRASSEPLHREPTLGQRALAAARSHDLAELASVLRTWRDELASRAAEVEPETDVTHPFLLADTRYTLPDDHLDAGLSNVVQTEDGVMLVESEWSVGQPVDLRLVHQRGLWALARDLVLFGIEHPWGDLATVDDVMRELASLADIDLAPRVAESWRTAEVELGQLVTGEPPDSVTSRWLDGSERAIDRVPGGEMASGTRGDELAQLARAYADLERRIAEMEVERSELVGQSAHLTGVVEALEAQVAHLRRPKGFLADQVRRRLR